MAHTTILSADLGGTNARMQLSYYNEETKSYRDDVLEKWYKSGDFNNLQDLILRFLRDAGWDIPDKLTPDYAGPVVHKCCMAICGPVSVDEIRHTGPQVPYQPPTLWKANMQETKEALHPLIEHACLINDFVAVGYGLTVVGEKDMQIIHDCPMQPKGVKACVGAGSGLGMCFMTWNNAGGHYVVHASEGGMADLRVRTQEDLDLLLFLKAHPDCGGNAIIEHVVSGNGLLHVYQWLNAKRKDGPELSSPAEVNQKAQEGDEMCLKAVKTVIRFYGEELRYSALRWAPYGGLYVVAGLVQRLMQWAKEDFEREFLNDNCMIDLLKDVPLIICDREDLGLIGARERARFLPQ